jgi:hypothetical protein
MNGNHFIKFFIVTLLTLPSINALTITNTTFHSSVSNYTIHVDSITLDNVTVTNLTIEFYNLTSIGSNFTNTNTTYDARADFYGLAINLIIRNINISTNLFTSTLGNQDYNATFTPGQILRILLSPTAAEITVTRTCNNLLAGLAVFFTFISIIILAVIGKFIISIFKGSKKFTLLDLVKIAILLITTGLIFLVGIAIVNIFCEII